jgi:hypothetical protein
VNIMAFKAILNADQLTHCCLEMCWMRTKHRITAQTRKEEAQATPVVYEYLINDALPRAPWKYSALSIILHCLFHSQ